MLTCSSSSQLRDLSPQPRVTPGRPNRKRLEDRAASLGGGVMQESSSGAEAHSQSWWRAHRQRALHISTTGPEVTQDVLGPRGCQKGLCQAPGTPGAPLALPLGSENRMCESGGRAPSCQPASSCLARCDSRCAQAGGDRACPTRDGVGNETGMRKDWPWAPEESTTTSLTHTPRARSASPLGHGLSPAPPGRRQGQSQVGTQHPATTKCLSFPS